MPGIGTDLALDLLTKAIKEKVVREPVPPSTRADLVVRVGGVLYVVEFKGNARSDTISGALAQLHDYLIEIPNAKLLLIVPKMGDLGAELCAKGNVNWLDLAGNASIEVPGLRVHIEGKKPQSKPIELGFNPFSRQASRVVHALLLEPQKPWNRADLSKTTSLTKGYVAKTVSALKDADLITEQRQTGQPLVLRVKTPQTLLDAWAERYRRPRPDVYGLLPTRDGFETIQRVHKLLTAVDTKYAFTGLAAAAAYTHFGSFRRVSLYAPEPLPASIIGELDVSLDKRGRNVVVTYDRAGIEVGAEKIEHLSYVSPILTYLDLLNEPERADEGRVEVERYIRERLWS